MSTLKSIMNTVWIQHRQGPLEHRILYGPQGAEKDGEMKTLDWVRTLTDDQLIEWRDKLGVDGPEGLKRFRVLKEMQSREKPATGTSNPPEILEWRCPDCGVYFIKYQASQVEGRWPSKQICLHQDLCVPYMRRRLVEIEARLTAGRDCHYETG